MSRAAEAHALLHAQRTGKVQQDPHEACLSEFDANDKPGAVPVRGNHGTINIEAMLAHNIQTSGFFTRDLRAIATTLALEQQIAAHVQDLLPCVRDAGRQPSSAFCCTLKLGLLRPTRVELQQLASHANPFVRGVLALYLRHAAPWEELWGWWDSYFLSDEQEFSASGHGAPAVSFSRWARGLLTELKYQGSLLPRLPPKVQTELFTQLALRPVRLARAEFNCEIEHHFRAGEPVLALDQARGRWVSGAVHGAAPNTPHTYLVVPVSGSAHISCHVSELELQSSRFDPRVEPEQRVDACVADEVATMQEHYRGHATAGGSRPASHRPASHSSDARSSAAKSKPSRQAHAPAAADLLAAAAAELGSSEDAGESSRAGAGSRDSRAHARYPQSHARPSGRGRSRSRSPEPRRSGHASYREHQSSRRGYSDRSSGRYDGRSYRQRSRSRSRDRGYGRERDYDRGHDYGRDRGYGRERGDRAYDRPSSPSRRGHAVSAPAQPARWTEAEMEARLARKAKLQARYGAAQPRRAVQLNSVEDGEYVSRIG